MLSYSILSFILIINLIVGQFAAAYKFLSRRRDILMLLETLSVREVSQPDEKYSAVVCAPYPLNMLNMILGVYVLSVKSPTTNRVVQHIYYIPTAIVCTAIFIAYQFVILPFAYVKVVFHKFALVVNNPKGIGSKTKSNRFGYAILFMFIGLFILTINCFFDIFWFVKHLYLKEHEIDSSIHAKNETTKSVRRSVLKTMLGYF